jgi:GAF domain-containing protein
VGDKHVAAIEPFAARAAASHEIVAGEAVGALLVPLMIDDNCLGVLAFVRPNGPAPDAELIETMLSLGTQAASFLRRV